MASPGWWQATTQASTIVAGSDWVSMYDFATAVAEAFDLDRDLVIPIDASTHTPPGSDPREQVAATRNLDLLGLDCSETVRRLGLNHPGLSEGLAAMRRRL